jgi:hypothetical protein
VIGLENKMTTLRTLLLGTLAATVLAIGPAYAAPADGTYNYSCHFGKGRTADLHVDTTKNILTWRGKKYAITNQPECAKAGWHAVGNGTAFDYCVATKGVGSIEQPTGQEGDVICDRYPSERAMDYCAIDDRPNDFDTVTLYGKVVESMSAEDGTMKPKKILDIVLDAPLCMADQAEKYTNIELSPVSKKWLGHHVAVIGPVGPSGFGLWIDVKHINDSK